jgi:hypothetical protein
MSSKVRPDSAADLRVLVGSVPGRSCTDCSRSAWVEVAGGVQLTSTQTFELEGVQKPVSVAQSLARFVAR